MTKDCNHPVDAREITSNVVFTSRNGGYKYTQIYLVCKRCGSYRCLKGKKGPKSKAWDPPEDDKDDHEN